MNLDDYNTKTDNYFTKNKKIFIGMVIIVVAVVIGFTVYIVNRKDETSNIGIVIPFMTPKITEPSSITMDSAEITSKPIDIPLKTVPIVTPEINLYNETMAKLTTKINDIVSMSRSMDKQIRDNDLKLSIITNKILEKGNESQDSMKLRNDISSIYRPAIGDLLYNYRNKVADIIKLANKWNIVISDIEPRTTFMTHDGFDKEVNQFNSSVAKYINAYTSVPSMEIIIPDNLIENSPLDAKYEDTDPINFVSWQSLNQSSMDNTIRKIDELELVYSRIATYSAFIITLLNLISKIDSATPTPTSSALPAAFRAYYNKLF